MLNRGLLIAGLVLIVAATRFLPHPPNFVPLGALALFAGACLNDKRLAFGVPLVAMFLSDLFIGMHAVMPFVYLSYALIVGMGLWLRDRRSILNVAGATLAGSFAFFAITNFGQWLVQFGAAAPLYSTDLAGLATCFAQAIPFFRNTLVGDVVYVTVFFGGLALAEQGLRARVRTQVEGA